MLNLKAGEQTLRFEVNNPGFELTDLQIKKLTDVIEVNDTKMEKQQFLLIKLLMVQKKLVGQLKILQLKILGLDQQVLIKTIMLMLKQQGCMI